MQTAMVVARALHVVSGAVWVGAVVVLTYFIMPAAKEVGPDAGKLMDALQRRGVLNFVPALALLTVLSGFFLMDRISAHFAPAWMGSATGIAFSIGATLALIGLAVGLTVMRPSALRAGRVKQQAMATEDPGQRSVLLTEAARLRDRTAAAARLVAPCLLGAALLMGIARYV